MTKREALILDSFFEEMERIKPPEMPYKQEEFEEFFIKKHSKESLFFYLSDNLQGSNPIKVISEFIATVDSLQRAVHKESILTKCLHEEKIFAKRVLKALTTR